MLAERRLSCTSNVIARRAIDEITEFSRETKTPNGGGDWYSGITPGDDGCCNQLRVMSVGPKGFGILLFLSISCRGPVKSLEAEYGARYSQGPLDWQIDESMCLVVHREDDSFAKLMRDLSLALRISLSKKRRLVAKLEALGERDGDAKPLEHMRDIVARDAVTLEELETLLARAKVRVSLKAGYVADMEENE
ncbi:hypothetical protein Tco_0123089 [Tanacetum coccineum]